jgi:type IV pilus assembly protein PilW
MIMNNRAQPKIRRTPRTERGLSLVELMISLAIGMFLLLGITSLIVQQNSSRDELEKSSRQIENGRYAIQVIRNDIQHAGYYGEFFRGFNPLGAALPDPCSITPAGLEAGFALPIQGYDFAPTAGPTGGSPLPCLNPANLKAGTDILVVRRANTEVENGGVNPGEILLQTNASSYVLNLAAGAFNTNNPPLPSPFNNLVASGAIPAPLREYWVRVYFVSPCSVPAGGGATCTCQQQPAPDRRCIGADDNGNPIPTLKGLDLTGENATNPPTPIPLAEGVENLQLDYGLDTDSDGYPDMFVTDPGVANGPNPGGPPGWQSVVSVRLNLLARNTSCTTGYQDNKIYNVSAPTGTIPTPLSSCTNGDYKRHLFIEQVRAINPSSRKAAE